MGPFAMGGPWSLDPPFGNKGVPRQWEGVLAVGRTLANASLGNGGSLGNGSLGNRRESLEIGVLLAMGPMAVRGFLGKGMSLSSRGALSSRGPLAVARTLGNGSFGNRGAFGNESLGNGGGP